jgi:hypothetical protein
MDLDPSIYTSGITGIAGVHQYAQLFIDGDGIS